MVQDWRSRIGSTRMKSVLLERIKGGSVVLLHDSGETFGADRDAPLYMLEALEEVIVELTSRHYRYVNVDQMAQSGAVAGFAKRIVVALWMCWERGFVKLMRVKPVDHDNTLLQLRVTEYRGKQTIHLPDGERIEQGDRIAELHLDNHLLYQLGSSATSTVHLAIQLVRRTELLMPQIIRLLQTDPDYKDVKGYTGSASSTGEPESSVLRFSTCRKAFFFFLDPSIFAPPVIHCTPSGQRPIKDEIGLARTEDCCDFQQRTHEPLHRSRAERCILRCINIASF